MLVLALDTTTERGSCALARAGVTLREETTDPSQPHAARLPGALMTLLEHEGVALDAIDLFAVTTGPGSFTSLRVGIATMQGLAFAMTRPLIGVSGLDALAWLAGRNDSSAGESPASSRIATWVDAWRGDVYASLYEAGTEVESPTVEPPRAVLARLGAAPVRFIGDGARAHADLIRAMLGPAALLADPIAPPLAGAIAHLASVAAAAGQRPDAAAIRPLYVRRPDAEMARETRVRA
jgi:tRNA threonylcarbamoyladenosine biosynthesis protein TsaB